ncbi:MAG: tRNA 4-thiouridine(8) synthase ThiI [Bacilli bacterium]|nr:tRNA 4-thiouridine(8) synthase ThiI [Bacilli bacterium]
MNDHILIRYGELSLKKSNRNQFIKKINNHIERALKAFPNLTFEARGLRFYIILNGESELPIIPILKKIPGIYSFSVVARCESNIEDIKKLAIEVLKEKDYQNAKFKVDTNRGDKNFPMTSQEITKEVSRELFRNLQGLKADVHNPDFILNIDVRYEGTFIFTDIIMGLGGFPAGILGKTMLMISGGIDSVIAGYEVIKKGMDVEAVHFASPPHTSDMALQKVVDLLQELTIYTSNQNINLHVVPFTKIQDEIYKHVREDYGITVMRRMMYRIAESLANKQGAQAIVNGESVGQVASQTLESMAVINNVTNMPVIRPLATLDKSDIIEKSMKIGTYDISIRPYEDCCTVFVPKHPQIKPKLEVAINEENKFDYQTLIEEALENTEVIRLRSDKKYEVFKTEDLF